LHKLSHWDDDLLAAIKHQRRKQISVKQSHIYLVKFTSTLGRVKALCDFAILMAGTQQFHQNKTGKWQKVHNQQKKII
jgi:hypothetical protein